MSNEEKPPTNKKMTTAELASNVCQQLKYFEAKPECKAKVHFVDTVNVIKILGRKLAVEPNIGALYNGFQGNLHLLQDLDELHFRDVTNTFCNLLTGLPKDRFDLLENLALDWLDYASEKSMVHRTRVFDHLFEKFKAIFKWLSQIGCFSIQVRILKVVFAYMGHNGCRINDLCDGIFDEDDAIWYGIRKFVEQNDEQKRMEFFFRDLPIWLNKQTNSVRSNIVQRLYFDGEQMTTYLEGFEAWLDINLGSRTMEFSIELEKNEVRIKIGSHNLQSWYYDKKDVPKRSREVTFKLNQLLVLNCETDFSIMAKRRVKEVRFVLNSFEVDQFEALLVQMFPNRSAALPVQKATTKPAPLDLNHNDTSFSEFINLGDAENFVSSTPVNNSPNSNADCNEEINVQQKEEQLKPIEPIKPQDLDSRCETASRVGTRKIKEVAKLEKENRVERLHQVEKANGAAPARKSVRSTALKPITNNANVVKLENDESLRPNQKGGGIEPDFSDTESFQFMKPKAKPGPKTSKPGPKSSKSIKETRAKKSNPMPPKRNTRLNSVQIAEVGQTLDRDDPEKPNKWSLTARKRNSTHNVAAGSSTKYRKIEELLDDSDSDDGDDSSLHDDKSNTVQQFEALRKGAACFKGQVTANANGLHRKLAAEYKSKREIKADASTTYYSENSK